MLAPLPPPNVFRTIKKLPYFFEQSGIFLALPRKIDGEGDSAFVSAVSRIGGSALEGALLALLPHVRVVKTYTRSLDVRREVEFLERFDAGPLARSQITTAARSSWLVEVPVFGATLAEYGEKAGGIPSWFLAHVFLGLLGAVEEIHDQGIAHRDVGPDNIVFNIYPRDGKWRYRGYPDIVIKNFGTAIDIDDYNASRDVSGLLRTMEKCIVEWSSSAPFLAYAIDGTMETDDPMMLVLRDVRHFLQDINDVPTLEEVREMFNNRLVDLRHEGPATMSPALARTLHSDLVTAEELEHALREPTVLKFGARHDEFVKVIAGEPVVMGAGGHAGMRTNRVLVVRFTDRKDDFGRIGRETSVESSVEEEMDITAPFYKEDYGEQPPIDQSSGADADDEGSGTDADAEGETDDDMDIDAEGETE